MIKLKVSKTFYAKVLSIVWLKAESKIYSKYYSIGLDGLFYGSIEIYSDKNGKYFVYKNIGLYLQK